MYCGWVVIGSDHADWLLFSVLALQGTQGDSLGKRCSRTAIHCVLWLNREASAAVAAGWATLPLHQWFCMQFLI